jgi:hypothetical protein
MRPQFVKTRPLTRQSVHTDLVLAFMNSIMDRIYKRFGWAFKQAVSLKKNGSCDKAGTADCRIERGIRRKKGETP